MQNYVDTEYSIHTSYLLSSASQHSRKCVDYWIQCRVYGKNYDNYPSIHLSRDINAEKCQKTCMYIIISERRRIERDIYVNIYSNYLHSTLYT